MFTPDVPDPHAQTSTRPRLKAKGTLIELQPHTMLNLSELRAQIDAFEAHHAETYDRRQRQCETAVEALHALSPRWQSVHDAVERAQPRRLVARMQERPDATHAAPERPPEVTVVATDGSQIYPDRHIEPTYFLLNISRVAFQYGTTEPPLLTSTPDLRFREDLSAHFDAMLGTMTPEMVSALRDEQELRHLLQTAREARVSGRPLVALADGTLIRWMIRGMHNRTVEERLIATYGRLLQGFADDRLPLASYISMPGNTEVVHLLQFDRDELDAPESDDTLTGLLDRTLFDAVLDVGERSAIFRSPSRIQSAYAAHSQICYTYLKVPAPGGSEIARLEMPAWVANEAALLDRLHSVILDECQKGNGYPIALSEAHEHAVIRGPEREAFVRLMERRLRRSGRSTTGSRKQRSKQLPRV